MHCKVHSEPLQGIQSIVHTKVPCIVRVYLVRDCIVWVDGHWAARYTEQTLEIVQHCQRGIQCWRISNCIANYKLFYTLPLSISAAHSPQMWQKSVSRGMSYLTIFKSPSSWSQHFGSSQINTATLCSKSFLFESAKNFSANGLQFCWSLYLYFDGAQYLLCACWCNKDFAREQ